jgi:hypothetical protein
MRRTIERLIAHSLAFDCTQLDVQLQTVERSIAEQFSALQTNSGESLGHHHLDYLVFTDQMTCLPQSW